MYNLKIKDNSVALDVAVLRTLFFAAAIAAVFLNAGVSLVVKYIPAIFLVILSLFTKVFLLARKVSKYLLLIIGAVLLFIAIHSLTALLLFLVAGILPALFYKAPEVITGDESVTLKRMIGSSTYPWNDFSNIILKDNLLTLDFKNNKVLQLELEENTAIDENAFNDFCAGKIMQ